VTEGHWFDRFRKWSCLQIRIGHDQTPAIFQITTFAQYLEYPGLVWITTLEENGIAVLPVDSEHVRLTDDDHSAIFFVLTIPRVARTHDIKPAPERHALLVAHSITSDALERAWAAGWSVVTDDGTGRLRLANRKNKSVRCRCRAL